MRRALGAAALAVASVFCGVSGPARAFPPVQSGYLTGMAGSLDEAKRLPCWSGTSNRYVGTACFDKLAPMWKVEQPLGCVVKQDVTTAFRMYGNCIFVIDDGTQLKLWAVNGAIDEDFTITWSFPDN
jgi:hypothetical protein